MNIIFDTDLTNEIDDVFALSYLLKSDFSDKVKAVTLAPYDPFWQSYDRKETMTRNKLEALKIFKLVEDSRIDMIFSGSKDFLNDIESCETGVVAVQQIISLCKEQKTLILATGCLTNIALAIQKYPEIAKNIELVWLGGKNPFNIEAKVEFNLRQDIKSAQIVFNNVNNITMIWSKEIAAQLLVSSKEVNKQLRNKNTISNYLLEIFNQLEKTKIEKEKRLYDIAIPIYITNPEYYQMEQLEIEKIDDSGNYVLGTGKIVTICKFIDKENILNQFFKTITK